ncbi:hypothetical protein DV736_g1483, partial [Chaetothyriales sp. CBS 134916]
MSIILKTLLLAAISSALAAPTTAKVRQDDESCTKADIGSLFPIHKSCNDTQAHLIAHGLNETIGLVTVARDYVLQYSNSSKIYQKYFGDRPPYEVIGAYDMIINGNKSEVLFRCDNPDGNCDIPGYGGHWRGSNATGETVICDLSYDTRKSLDYMCMLGYTVATSPTNTFWASDLMHRLYHIPAMGWGYIEHFAEDYDEVLELAANETSTDSTHDSDTLQYFALEVYAYEVAVPGEGCPGNTTESEGSSATPTEPQTTSQTVSVPAGCHTHEGGELHCASSTTPEPASSTASAPADTRVKPRATPGYIYLYYDDDFLHFCWRPRSKSLHEPELDLIMVPSDGQFIPYKGASDRDPHPAKRATNGRIYLLKFASSPARHLFWLQSRSQHPQQDQSWFSERDLKLGAIVNAMLQGEDVDVQEELASAPNGDRGPEPDDDETMEDIEGTNHDHTHHPGGSGGPGPDATGGDFREEGEQSREGGADGGRAVTAGAFDAGSIIQNFINSIPGGSQQQPAQAKLFTTLQDLLATSSTIAWVDSKSVGDEEVDNLLQFLPPQLAGLTARAANPDMEDEIDEETEAALVSTLSLDLKKDILRRVLRSPQFIQSLASLTIALRDGGLPTVSGALDIPVQNNGYMRRGGVPLGGGEAVEAFVDGVKEAVKKKQQGQHGADDQMDTQ